MARDLEEIEPLRGLSFCMKREQFPKRASWVVNPKGVIPRTCSISGRLCRARETSSEPWKKSRGTVVKQNSHLWGVNYHLHEKAQ